MYEHIGYFLYASKIVVNRLYKNGIKPYLKHLIMNFKSFTALYTYGS